MPVYGYSQLSCSSGTSGIVRSCSSVMPSTYLLIRSFSPDQKSSVWHWLRWGQSTDDAKHGMAVSSPSTARRISPEVISPAGRASR